MPRTRNSLRLSFVSGRHFTKANKAVVLLLTGIFSWWLIFVQDENNIFEDKNESDAPKASYDRPFLKTSSKEETVGKYAVFTACTPNGESHRSFDYAFYLPLTALAWERIGFRSVVVIAGSRCEWTNDPALRLILNRLEVDRRAVVIFLETALENRIMIGQTIRIFAANLEAFPGKGEDFLITADADQWPLRREHFLPRPGHDLVLVHKCCDPFTVPWRKNQSFQMYSMMNIGASVGTWREIMNRGRSVANDSESIMTYYEEEGFGPKVRQKVEFASHDWYYDQLMVSIRLSEWMDRHGNGSPPVYRVSDDGFKVTHRNDWDGDLINSTEFKRRSDAHMLLKPFLPEQWEWMQPMMAQMYGGRKSALYSWCQDYYQQFREQIKYYLHLTVVDYDKQV